MDQNRQFRFLIPPFFFIASLYLGAYLHEKHPFIFVKEMGVGGVAAITASLLPLGFLISTISIVLLKQFWKNYEADISKESAERIWKKLEISKNISAFEAGEIKNFQNEEYKKANLNIYITATFDHSLLPTGIHEWIMRRWNIFNASAHSVTALILSLPIGCFFWSPNWGMGTIYWVIIVLSISLFLGVAARKSWKETMEMIDFQSHKEKPKECNACDEKAMD
ncbi:hypothetical protein HY772_01695 [Candidatus Woesearchaeota archaeon]|nr:hypothetical protein [Candidatus Woesearchaeota archaeon]